MAGLLNAPDRLIKRYMGHGGGDVYGRHYRRIDVNELRAVSERFNRWRELPHHGGAWKHSGNIDQSQADQA